MTSKAFDNKLLASVSRSFYLSLRALPGRIRESMGLAYLLARATDTIADTRLLQVERRLAALRALREDIVRASRGIGPDMAVLAELLEIQPRAAGAASGSEKRLLDSLPALLARLARLEAADRVRIRSVLEHIAQGQENDLLRFGSGTLAALETDEELDTYTFQVAGCVGEFWNAMCRAHLFPEAQLNDASLCEDAVRFGKGLQLVNILRDLPRDLRQGRCYMPRQRLDSAGLQPEDLLRETNMILFRPVFTAFLDRAGQFLRSGWDYTLALPRRHMRVRLACAWPLLIGARTLRLLREANILDDGAFIKIDRREVRRWLARTVVRYPSARSWNRLFDHAQKR